jgi:GTP diphosphokinase / guanosine-3',5'-bis(diphosphate) 3'-diphosphatase
MEFKTLKEKIEEYLPGADFAFLEKVFAFSKNAHKDQKRESGADYFTHCYWVARILADYKLDLPTICAGLLHDVLEDTSVTPEGLEKEFGKEITDLVLGVTKIEKFDFSSHDEQTAENWRKMLLATAKDIRVILVKLADRLDNMRTVSYLPQKRQAQFAAETLNLFAPLAQRLGMFSLKSELEDLSFKTLYPKDFEDLQKNVQAKFKAANQALSNFKKDLEKHLSKTDIPHRVVSRQKNFYSIRRKMQSQKITYHEIQDTLGVRIITDNVSNCYALLGIVHSAYKPLDGSFTDYIALPKINMYQSLHTTIISPAGDIVEIQIRTENMHRTCEYGIAAHWRYKMGDSKDLHLNEKLDWLKQWIEWLQDLTGSREFIETFKTDLELQQVFIFTPKGEVKALPQGSTPLDFAYCVHSEIGNKCVGAKINNRIVSLDYELKSGEICEILTRKNAVPHQNWLKIVKTARARSHIRRYFQEHKKK